MQRKDRMDAVGAAMLVGFALLFALNQVLIKQVNQGLQPVFYAGLRSAGAVVCVWLWMAANRRPMRIEPGTVGPGLLAGAFFSAEFILLFVALDLTTVVRSSIIFYSMPLWLALGANFLLPGERITAQKAVGLAVAFGGVAWAILNRGDAGQGSLAGDLCALGAAMGWAGTALVARGSALNRVRPEMQLFWMVLVSAVVLLAISPLFGPLVRDLRWIHVASLGFQITVIVTAGFILWLWLLTVYPAASVASFSFLTPVFGVALGWLLLGEQVSAATLVAAALVALGILLINSAAKPA